MKKIFRLNLICMFFFLVPNIYAQNIRLLEVKAKKNDNIYTLLSRYHLPKISYYFNHFHVLNIENIEEDTKIKAGKKYLLPIRIFKYNGKSIRSTINLNDFERAKRIQEYNEIMLELKFKNKDYRKNNILWIPFHELEEDVTIDFPDFKKKNTVVAKIENNAEITYIDGSFSIFGKDYSKVEFIDNSLKNCIYYIVGGHGGPDPGAIGNRDGHQLCEDEYAYDISLRVAYKLLGHGAKVYIITRDKNDGIRSQPYLKCDKDEYCWGNKKIPLNPSKRLKQRAVAINELFQKHKNVKKQRLVIFHVDSSSEKNRIDIFFYYHSKNKTSKQIAKVLHQTIKSKYRKYQPKRKYTGVVKSRDNLYMLYTTAPPSVYIELANIRNPNDQLRLIKPENRQAVSDWITEGLVKEIKLYNKK